MMPSTPALRREIRAPSLVDHPGWPVSLTTGANRATGPFRARLRGGVAPRRRRLRREFRVAARVLGACAGLGLLWWGAADLGRPERARQEAGISDRPERLSSARPSDSTLAPMPRASLSLEPIGEETRASRSPLLVQPAGFVLPDDGSEDLSHAHSGG
jgi:hypothetical protein